MLFNSYTFLLIFLPLAVLGFHLLRKGHRSYAFTWLVACSLFFYGYWNPIYVPLVLAACTVNFWIGRYLAVHHGPRGKWMLTAGITGNLLLLGYYKYTGFLQTVIGEVTGTRPQWAEVILPLGISFFTFQKIAYLVDAYRGKTKEYRFLDFLLFVFFFPQLIAGPIVHHGEIMPQFRKKHPWGTWKRDFAVGLGILALGLFKKVVVADQLAVIASRLFDLAGSGARPLTMAEAWCAAIAYSLQLYFDFSGYTDMAIGAARFFGILLPLNFNSPYKSASIVDFWRRWHMTLSRFLRDYLYIGLGGNRKGPTRRYVNLMITMLLGGFWHGAGWTFLFWGGLHGAYLCVNHAWVAFRKKHSLRPLPKPVGVLITFIVVVMAWVFFRANSFSTAGSILRSMVGLNGFSGWPDKALRVVASADPVKVIPVLLACWLLPNTQQIFGRYRPALDAPLARETRRFWQWRPTWPYAFAVVGLLVVVGLYFDKVSEFIYFQF